MKKFGLIVCFLGLGMCFTECSTSPENKAEGDDPLHIVFVTTCVGEDFFNPVKKGMLDAAELMGVTCEFIGTEEVDLEGQVEMMEKAIKQGADGIALNIIDAEAFDRVIEEAIGKGIPVVAFNTDDNSSPNARLSSVNQDLFNAGKLFGERILKDIPTNSKVLVTQHSAGISALDDRMSGMLAVLKRKNIRAKVAITGIHADAASRVIADALKANPEIKTILCTGLADTEGAGMAIEKEFADQNILAAGFDLSLIVVESIRNGHLVFTIDQQPYMQGFYPVIQLVQNIRYGIIPNDMNAGASVVSKDNIDNIDELIEQGYR